MKMTGTVELKAAELRSNEREFVAWLTRAKPSDRFQYHRGFLMRDIVAQSSRLRERDRLELVRLARRAWLAAREQLVHLVQRRHGPDDYTYFAIASSKPKKAESCALLQRRSGEAQRPRPAAIFL